MEGDVPYLYQDVKGLVSIGIGILLDAEGNTEPPEEALSLPFVHLEDGTRASREEIADEWRRIKRLGKNAQGLTAAKLGHTYARPFTRLRLTPETINAQAMRKFAWMDAELAKRFPDYPVWPADGQMGVLSLSWANGPWFRYPKCEAALRLLDFRTAAIESFMKEEATISGLRPRNRANNILFRNASVVQQQSALDPDALFYPRDLDLEAELGALAASRDAPTMPALPNDDDAPVVIDGGTIHPDVPLGIPGHDDDD